MAAEVSLEAPWETPGAEELDGQTAETWLRRHVRTRGARALMQLGIEAVWAAQPEDISLLHLLFYIRSAGSLDLLFDTEGGAQQDRFVGGSQRVAERMAEELGPGRLLLEAPARRISHGGQGVRVEAGEHTVTGRRAVVAVAPSLAGRIDYEPALPGLRDQLTQRMPLGTVAKCMAIYEEPFWRADGLSGQATSTRGPIKLTYDNSPPDGSPGVLLGFLEGTQAREAGEMPAAERRNAVLDCFARLFGSGPAPPIATSSACGPRRSGPAVATAPTCPRAPGPATAARCARPSGPSTGPARRRRRCGTATWTARCGPARTPRAKF